jgi:maleamate amidohydrolase
VMDAFQNNFHCIVPFDCVADRNQLSHKVSLFDLHMKYADVVSLDETVDYLDQLHKGAAGVPDLQPV